MFRVGAAAFLQHLPGPRRSLGSVWLASGWLRAKAVPFHSLQLSTEPFHKAAPKQILGNTSCKCQGSERLPEVPSNCDRALIPGFPRSSPWGCLAASSPTCQNLPGPAQQVPIAPTGRLCSALLPPAAANEVWGFQRLAQRARLRALPPGLTQLRGCRGKPSRNSLGASLVC